MHRKTIIFLLCAAFSSILALNASAQTGEITTNCTTSTKDCYIFTDRVQTFKTFKLEVLEEGDYYASIWSCPTLYDTGQYIPLSVQINEKLVSDIEYTKGNWQGTLLNSGKSIRLKKGTNTISISCKAPMIPNIESLYLSSNIQDVVLSDAKYSEYLAKAKNGQQVEPTTLLTKSLSTKDIDASHAYTKESVPLKYSFHTSCYFEQNQEIHFVTSANVPHAIDIFYYGSNINYNIDFSSTNEGQFLQNKTVANTASTFTTTFPHKLNILYTPATSDEIQGLNWKRISQRSTETAGMYQSELTITFPKAGFYMVKLRSLENGVLGIADLSIGEQAYKNVPVFYSSVDCIMPADGTPYTAVALRGTETLSDPMLFVEGNDGYRIVGYSDDNNGTILGKQVYNEAIIRQIYNIDTQRLHICNYSSENPESTCEIIGCISDDENAAAEDDAISLSTKNATRHNRRQSIISKPEISNSLYLKENGIEVDIYDLTGKKIGAITTFKVFQNITSLDLPTDIPGVYILRTNSENGTMQKKLIIK